MIVDYRNFAFAISRAPIIVLSKNFDVLEVNPALLQLYHGTIDHIVGRPCWDLLGEHLPLRQLLVEGGTSSCEGWTFLDTLEIETTVKHELITVRWYAYVSQEQDNTIYLLSGENITNTKILADKVYELDRIIAQLPGNVYWYNQDFVYLGCNENSAKTLGLTREAAVGQDFRELMKRIKNIDEHTVESFVHDGAEVIRTGQPKLNIEEPPFIGPEGEASHWLANKVPLRDRSGRTYGVVGISTDITYLKNLEQELMEVKTREAQFKAMSTMGGMIAHELRTPLSGMRLGLTFIEKCLPILLSTYTTYGVHLEPSIPPEHLSSLKNVCSNLIHALGRMDDTIDTILSGFRSVEASPETLVPVELAVLVRECMERYPLTERERKLISINHVEGVALGSAQVLSHVLSNLIKNSLFFIQEVGKGEIFISTTVRSDGICLHVKDTAKGIPSHQLQQIFEPFYTTKSTATSIGMGLYFCKLALQKTCAEIWCESVEGQYAEFIIRLPPVL